MYKIYACENIKKYKNKIYKYNYFRLIYYDENRLRVQKMFKTFELAEDYVKNSKFIV